MFLPFLLIIAETWMSTVPSDRRSRHWEERWKLSFIIVVIVVVIIIINTPPTLLLPLSVIEQNREWSVVNLTVDV